MAGALALFAAAPVAALAEQPADAPPAHGPAQRAKDARDQAQKAQAEKLQAELVHAAEQDNAEQVAALLARHVSPDAALGDGTTPLHWAAYNDDPALVQLLLKAGAKPEPRTRLQGLTPLHMAAEGGDAALIDLLLKAGAGADVPNENGTTPLMIAAASGSAAAVETLIAHGAQVNAREKTYGQTALFFAASRNRADVVRLLLSKGADSKVRTTIAKLARVSVGPDGELLDDKKAPAKPAQAARAEDAQPEAAKKADAKPEAKPAAQDDAKPEAKPATYAEGKPDEKPGAKQGANPEAKPDDKVKDAYGFTAADRKKRVYGTNQIGGMTALLVAARDGQADAVAALLDAGDDVNQISDTDHATPLILAVINGHYDLAKLLLDRGADVKLSTVDGATPLYAVIDVQWAPHTWYPQPVISKEHTAYLDLAAAFLAHGADPNAQIGKKLWFRSFANDETWFDVEGATPFLRAALSGDLAAMKLLAEHGANPNLGTKSGDTPLMAAGGVGWAAYWTSNAPYSRLDAAKFCLDHGADLNAKDVKGYSALHGAAFRGDNEMIKYFIALGADVHAKTKDGDTVADLANGLFEHAVVHPDTVALLEHLGSLNSHNCRSNECVVPTKEDKPAVVATAAKHGNALAVAAQSSSATPATPPAVALENKPK
jgi:ankyrin repeat protein